MIDFDFMVTLEDIEAEKCRRDFYTFVKSAWDTTVPGVEFIDGWHIEAICNYLQALTRDQLPSNTLVINVPPTHTKSLLVNVFFPAWVWTFNPSAKFICTTHAEARAIGDSLKCRNLVDSEWYRIRFNLTLAKDDQQKARFGNSKGGYRFAFGLQGLTGEHADYICVDDPLDIEDRYSKLELEKVNDVWDNILPTRLNDPKKSKKILIMQRLGTNDLVGHIQSNKEDAEFLILPARYEGERFSSSIGFVDPRQDGELLWPERFDLPEILKLERTMSSMDVAGQLQQRPTPLSGAVFKRDWFSNRQLNTDIVARYLSFDTASSISDTSAYSAGIVGELTSDYHLFIREVWREKVAYPQLQEKIEEMAERWNLNLRDISVESKSSGISVIQSLTQSTDLGDKLVPITPTTDKVARAQLAANWCQLGCVILPPPDSTMPWLNAFEEELFNFPSSEYMDQVDAFTQLINHLSYLLAEGLNARSNQ